MNLNERSITTRTSENSVHETPCQEGGTLILELCIIQPAQEGHYPTPPMNEVHYEEILSRDENERMIFTVTREEIPNTRVID